MTQTARVKPSRPMSAVAVIVGLTFVGIGVAVIITFTWSIGGPALWFTLLWTVVSASITLFHALNAFSKRGVAFEEVQFDGHLYHTRYAAASS